MKICECGCGRTIEPIPRHRYKPPRFIRFHAPKGRGRKRGARFQPDPKDIPSGLCECGCGGKTGIATRTVKPKRWFLGHPVPRLPAHGRKQLRENNHRWRGGKTLSVKGYVLLYMPDHPSADVKGYIKGHRHVWEQANGRLLQSDEHVHHINGIKDDNRLENLVMLTKTEHAKEHGPERMKKAQERHPDMASRGGKLGAAVRWKNHKMP